MKYTEDYLRRLCNREIIGDFPPFDGQDTKEVIYYIQKLVGRLKNNHHLLVEADFKSYGSGYASYVPVKISKRDKSDRKITVDGDKRTEDVQGILLYICKRSPNWFYGGMCWTENYQSDQYTGGSEGFLIPDRIAELDLTQWQDRLIEIEQIICEFRYCLIDRGSLAQSLWFKIDIPTILGESPYTVFDCFFYWED
jgi:hypothetical protein